MTSLVLPQLPPSQVQFLNTIFGANRELAFHISDDAYQVQFTRSAAEIDAAFSFEVSGSVSEKLWVSLSEASRLAGLQRWLGPCQLDDLPEGLAEIVLDAYLAVFLDSLSSKIGESFAISEVRCGAPPAEQEYQLPFKLTTADDQCVRGTLNFDSGWASTIERMLPLAAVTEAQSLRELCIPVPIELGRMSLTVSELQTLEPFDVVLLDSSDLITRQRVTLRLPPAFEIDCTFADERMNVEAIKACQSDKFTESAASSINDIRIPLSIQCGCASVTCDQLTNLSRGDVLTHRSHDAQSVDIVQSDRVLGRGELVRGGDRLGVRLLSLSSGSMRKTLAGLAEQSQTSARNDLPNKAE